jgi:tRNA(Arg) A34 adenosine deaminase TadA
MEKAEEKVSSQDLFLLRVAFKVALRAAAAGNTPFGAILADKKGQIVLEAENTTVTNSDPTGHAETNLVRMITEISNGSSLGEYTLYASTEPCPMCSGAIYWGNISRVVFGLGIDRFYSLAGEARESEAFFAHCRDILSRGRRPVKVIGPVLEDEAAAVHEGYWS